MQSRNEAVRDAATAAFLAALAASAASADPAVSAAWRETARSFFRLARRASQKGTK